ANPKVMRGITLPKDVRVPYKRGVFFFGFWLCLVRWEPAPVDLLAVALSVFFLLNVGTGRQRSYFATLLVALSYLFITHQALTMLRFTDTYRSVRYWGITVLVVLMAVIGVTVGQNIGSIRALMRGLQISTVVFTAI